MNYQFRAYDTKDKQMVYGDEYSYKGTLFNLSGYISEDNPIDRYKLMLNSTLSDKNNNSIYAGDIVRYPELYETPEYTSTQYSHSVVVFAEGSFYLEEKDGKYLGENTLAYEMFCYDGDLEVIGNIYETPELFPES